MLVSKSVRFKQPSEVRELIVHKGCQELTPLLAVTVMDTFVRACLDTGAQISILSTNFYDTPDK